MHSVCHSLEDLWFRVTEFDKSNQGIAGGVYRIHLRNRTYDYGRFDPLHFSCAHAIAAYSNQRLGLMSFVDQVYKLEKLYNVWRQVSLPIPDERMWPPISSVPFKLLPDRRLRHKPKGRPMFTRICDNMDIREMSNQPRVCGWCRNQGHTMSSFPLRKDYVN
ncbi:hypothetical protein J1N35_007899 [Gossypium stocksii]|uniref:Zinc finger PMZ-type domain-containing protein n=1 Tax=Gossypium stocksii TaxID=47602 RepID=A0A9D3W839_9ROSI|nr:hypothetical protein J1N35_007899 [Gossypium stocksii]